VSEDAAPERTAVVWSHESRVDLRAIKRDKAIQILHDIFTAFTPKLAPMTILTG
jgi:hypothetical protein